MNYYRASKTRTALLLISLVAALIFCACGGSGDKSTFTPTAPVKFKAVPIQLSIDQIFEIDVVSVRPVRSRALANPIRTLRKSNRKVAGEPVQLSPITPIVTTPGKGPYKKPEEVAVIDSPRIGRLAQSTLAGNPHLRDDNPSSIGSYSTLHGLKTNLVFALHQDRLGNIWMGTYGGGVVRYDGKYMTNYSAIEGLPGLAFRSICETQDGSLWFGSPVGGITRYNGTHFNTFTANEGLISNNVWNLTLDPKGNLWTCGIGGISKFDGHKFTNFNEDQGLFSKYVFTSLVTSDGDLWFGMAGGMCRFDGTHFYTYAGDFEYNNEVRSMAEDRNGQLWIGTAKGVFRFDGNFFWSYATTGLPQGLIYDLFNDDQGDLWICSDSGIYQFSLSQENGKYTIVYFGKDEGLNDETVLCGMQDNRGNYWFGTNGGGVSQYKGPIFEHIEMSKIRGLTTDLANQVWIATYGNGICQIDEREINRYTTDHGISTNLNQTTFAARDGSIWIGTWGAGVDHLAGDTVTNFSNSNCLMNNYIFCIMQDHQNNIWIGSNTGLSKFDGKTITNYKSDLGIVWDVFEDSQHQIWISQGSSLLKLDGNQVSQMVDFKDLGMTWVSKVIEDQLGEIWLASGEGGMFHFDGIFFHQYTREWGLSSNSIMSAIVAHNGEIITGNNHGLNRIFLKPGPGSTSAFVSTRNYLHSDGFLGVGCYSHSISQDTDGMIWIGTQDRVTIFNPQADVPDTMATTIQLRDILIFNEALDWVELQQNPDSMVILANGVVFKDFKFTNLSKWYSVPLEMQLSPDNNYLTFQFIGITTKNSDKVRYEYFLEGLDNQWSSASEASEATYNNLPHGHFTFKVKAVNSDGYWSDELTYPFIIQPPWWFSTTAYFFYGLLFISGIWLVHTYQRKRVVRIERMKAQQKELEQAREIENAYQVLKTTQAQLIQSEKMASLGELTAGIAHEIQNPLNFVNNFSEVSSELIEEAKEGLDQGDIEESKEILNELIQNLQKISHHGLRASSIVKGMLDHSRTSSGEKVLTDINQLCDEYLRLAYHGMRAKDKSFNATYKLDLDPDLPKVNVVPQDIGRVLLNLINNALQACAERSRSAAANNLSDLTGQSNTENSSQSDLSSKSKTENLTDLAKPGADANLTDFKPMVSVSTTFAPAREGDSIQITISDNGPGIPDEIKDKIFQPFFTTKPTGQGTGLGLSLSYDIVKAHGGKLIVESAEGEGTEFIIELPII